ncbi:MAG: SPFH/Band 7/PHB domain protein [Actinobacteria bacterium]|nr:MAG: SPFH/Band 7/PHB domain protein [Actinomycetota bacterium]
MENAAVVVLLFILLLIVYVAMAIKIVQQHEQGLVERFGRYRKTLDPGFHMIVPFIEKLKRVDMREQVVDVPPQEVITRDNVVVTVDAVVYYQATDPVKLKYNVANFILAATKLAQTNLRNVVGDMDLDDALTSRETINSELRAILDEATDVWGTRVVRVEIQRIDPPADVTDAMHRQMKAERDRRALVTEAEGEKRSLILRAEGIKESRILEAQGQAEAIKQVADAERYQKLTVAEGEAQAIEKVFGAIHTGDPTPDLIAIRYLEALQGVANGQATKIFLPLETSAVLSSLGAIAEVFQRTEDGAGGVPGG